MLYSRSLYNVLRCIATNDAHNSQISKISFLQRILYRTPSISISIQKQGASAALRGILERRNGTGRDRQLRLVTGGFDAEFSEWP